MFPMGMVTQRMTQGRWRSKLITSSTTWTVPADVGCIWVDACGGGGGGGGGDPTPGGGGGGGGPSLAIRNFPLAVIPGETLTLSIGANGLGGAAGQNGGDGGYTRILRGVVHLIGGLIGNGGTKGTADAGGAGSSIPYGASGASYGGTNTLANYMANETADTNALSYFSGTNGGALSASGSALIASCLSVPIFIQGAPGNASGGGGGHGGVGPFYSFSGGHGGFGGENGGAGSNGSGYGCGGGGGSGNSKGGDGSPGMIRIYCFTAYAI